MSICSIHSIEIDNVWEQCLDEVVRAPCLNVNGVMLLVSCYKSATTGFSKVDQVDPLGALTDTQGATSSNGVKRGPLTVKGP